MSKEVPVWRFGFSAPDGARIQHGLLQDRFGFCFRGVETEDGLLFLQVGLGRAAGLLLTRWRRRRLDPARKARLRQCSPVLRRALAVAALRARRRQAQLRREQLIEELGAPLTQSGVLARWLDCCLSPAELEQGPLRWGLC